MGILSLSLQILEINRKRYLATVLTKNRKSFVQERSTYATFARGKENFLTTSPTLRCPKSRAMAYVGNLMLSRCVKLHAVFLFLY